MDRQPRLGQGGEGPPVRTHNHFKIIIRPSTDRAHARPLLSQSPGAGGLAVPDFRAPAGRLVRSWTQAGHRQVGKPSQGPLQTALTRSHQPPPLHSFRNPPPRAEVLRKKGCVLSAYTLSVPTGAGKPPSIPSVALTPWQLWAFPGTSEGCLLCPPSLVSPRLHRGGQTGRGHAHNHTNYLPDGIRPPTPPSCYTAGSGHSPPTSCAELRPPTPCCAPRLSPAAASPAAPGPW